MKALESKILNEGRVLNNDFLKVDSFFNYQIDTNMLKEIAEFIVDHVPTKKIDKVLTLEASGIAFAVAVAHQLKDAKILYAKKSRSLITLDDDNYVFMVHSFTHNMDNNIYLRKNFLKEGDNVLIVDDFLAAGSASTGLINICKQAKANVVAVGIGIEKTFQGGRKLLEDKGIKVISCARILEFKDNKPIFSKEEC